MLEQEPKDDLTGFSLRKDFYYYLEGLITKSSAGKKNFSLILLDVDHFKKFNDKFGHPFGDEVLKYMAKILRISALEELYHFFRYGGDEFIVVLPDVDLKGALSVVSKFKYSMARNPFALRDRFLRITTSSGIVNFPQDGQTIEELIKKADQAMYFSKQHGRNATTLAGRMVYLKLCNRFLTGVLLFFFIVNMFLAYEFILKPVIPKALDFMRAVKITLPSLDSDRIILRNGTVFDGKIRNETNSSLVLGTYSEKGALTTVNLDKSEIKKIIYGLRTSSKERYREYIKSHPNPHQD